MRAALDSGHVAGAAFDVFIDGTGDRKIRCSAIPSVVCTPHLGAATSEAQENVALQVAEQMSDYLTRGAISNAVNFPSITAEEAPKLRPFIALAEKLGSFAGQLTETGIKKVTITYEGDVAGLKTKALTAAAIAGLLRAVLADVNVVSAPAVAEGTRHCHRRSDARRGRRLRIADHVTVTTEGLERISPERSSTTAGRASSRSRVSRSMRRFAPSMIYVTNEDKPGFIGRFASLLGDAGINIATFALGRDQAGGSAIALVEVDGRVPDALIAEIKKLPGVKQATPLHF